MSKCKYYLEKEVVSYDGGITWNETGVTRKGNLYEESSEDCTDPSVQYRWINMDISTDYICDGTNKYYKQKKLVSYDGIIWQDVTPAEYQRGSIYEVNSPDCQPTYRWVNLDISTDYICDGTTKYYKQKKQVSYGGQEWQDVIPYEYQRGDVYETQSIDCGYTPEPIYRWANMDISTDWICEYVPPTIKLQETYLNGITYEKECDGNATLLSGETRPSGYDLNSLKGAVIGDCVTTIGDCAFSACTNLTSVTIPNSVTIIDNYAFADCRNLTSVVIPNSVTSIGVNAFQYCRSLSDIILSNNLASINGYTFYGCSGLTSIVIPDSVTSIDNYAFSACTHLTSVTLSSSLTTIGGGVFKECSGLTSVTIPNSVTSIGGGVFEYCRGLTSVVIPNSVTSIGGSAFRYCRNLASVTCLATTPPTLGGGAFNYTNDCPIYVPASSVETYKTASGWKTYADRIQTIP